MIVTERNYFYHNSEPQTQQKRKTFPLKFSFSVFLFCYKLHLYSLFKRPDAVGKVCLIKKKYRLIPFCITANQK